MRGAAPDSSDGMVVLSATLRQHKPSVTLALPRLCPGLGLSAPAQAEGNLAMGLQIESGRLRSASAMRATPCRSAGYGTGSGGVARIVRVKLPVSFRHSFAPASGGRGFALGFLGRHAANALRA